jgi:TatD DNase family protein
MCGMLDLIDSHFHPESFLKDKTWEHVLEESLKTGTRRMIAIGTSPADWELYKKCSLDYPQHVHFTVGLHPGEVDEQWDDHLMLLSPFFAGDKVPLGVGEIGLDYFYLAQKPKEEAEQIIRWQQNAFRKQLAIALQMDCPVVVHSRSAFEDCVKIIDESGVDWKKVVFHCFVEGPKEIQAINERGGRGSFTGIITYKKAQTVRDALLAQGLDKLMIETDSPYLSPEPHRSKTNMPAHLHYIAEYCADIFDVTTTEIGKVLTRNTEEFFSWR